VFYFDGEMALAVCVLRKKVHPGDVAGGFSDLEMTWLLYCAGAATVGKVDQMITQRSDISKHEVY